MAVNEPDQAPMGIGMAALITLGVVLIIVGFLVLGGTLGLVPLYAGFLLLWYFAGIDVLDTGALPALAVGAVCGTLTAWLLQYGVAAWGAAGAIPALVVIILAIFLQLLGKLPIAINRAYMLYVTVLAAPLLQQQESFGRVLLTIALATVYFGGIVWLGRWIAARRKAG
ncbi:hypothetical protein [Sandaracinobacteroides hominis]|uniref:hypothetical protein n=1 Tax=Sandaracinobacteroides hominis TaxID=2780086 RepID=UPI0018F443BE|nr:hypothetical protein [Sandaracinobacteroides hominis]